MSLCLSTNKKNKQEINEMCAQFSSSSIFLSFRYVETCFEARTDEKYSLGVFVVLFLKRVMMMMTLFMRITAIIELKTGVRIRTRCVNMTNRYN